MAKSWGLFRSFSGFAPVALYTRLYREEVQPVQKSRWLMPCLVLVCSFIFYLEDCPESGVYLLLFVFLLVRDLFESALCILPCPLLFF